MNSEEENKKLVSPELANFHDQHLRTMVTAQMTLDNERMIETFRFDGWEMLHKLRTGSIGAYDPRTDAITINLDMLVDYFFSDFWYGKLKAKHIDILIQKISDFITHEHMHYVLTNLVSRKASKGFDNFVHDGLEGLT
jgi:hypothetical protein